VRAAIIRSDMMITLGEGMLRVCWRATVSEEVLVIENSTWPEGSYIARPSLA
jgi:hypothetical protein